MAWCKSYFLCEPISAFMKLVWNSTLKFQHYTSVYQKSLTNLIQYIQLLKHLVGFQKSLLFLFDFEFQYYQKKPNYLQVIEILKSTVAVPPANAALHPVCRSSVESSAVSCVCTSMPAGMSIFPPASRTSLPSGTSKLGPTFLNSRSLVL